MQNFLFFFISIDKRNITRIGKITKELIKSDKVYFDVGSNQIRDELIFNQIKKLLHSFRLGIKLFD